KRLKEKISIPLAAGERDRTIFEFLPYLEHRCLDVLQPDCCHTGGITSMKKIAVLAEAYQVPLAPPCTAGVLARRPRRRDHLVKKDRRPGRSVPGAPGPALHGRVPRDRRQPARGGVDPAVVD